MNKKFGTIRANPLAVVTNGIRFEKDWELPYGVDSTTTGAMIAARTVVGFVYDQIDAGASTVLLDSPVANTDVEALLGPAIYNKIKGHEFDVKITASWAADVISCSHWGQSVISKLIMDDASEVVLART